LQRINYVAVVTSRKQRAQKPTQTLSPDFRLLLIFFKKDTMYKCSTVKDKGVTGKTEK